MAKELIILLDENGNVLVGKAKTDDQFTTNDLILIMAKLADITNQAQLGVPDIEH